MTDHWQHGGDVAHRVMQDTARRSGNVVKGPWPDADTQERDRLEREQCQADLAQVLWSFGRKYRRICGGASKVAGIFRAVAADFDQLAEAEKQDKGGAA